jgi:hypothetical protein
LISAAVSCAAKAFSLLRSLTATYVYHAPMTPAIAPTIPTTNPITRFAVSLLELDDEVGDEEELVGDRLSVMLDNEDEVAGEVVIEAVTDLDSVEAVLKVVVVIIDFVRPGVFVGGDDPAAVIVSAVASVAAAQ